MSLRFMIGRSGSGKSTACKQEIIASLQNDPMGAPIIYLVPDQMTFQSEYELINTDGIGGMIRAQVFSFSRLAWRVLQETGGISRYHLNNVGINMLLRKIIELRKQELKLFTKVTEKSGFIEHVEQMITELKRYCVSPEDIKRLKSELDNGKKSQLLIDKLTEVQIIYEDIEKYLVHKYIDSEDYLQLLAEKISKSSYLQNAVIYIDGFHSFTPQELLVIQELMKKCQMVTVTLTVDKDHLYQQQDLDLFHMTSRTYVKITEIAKENGITIEKTLVLNKNFRHHSNPSLVHLEKHIETRPTISYEHEAEITISQAPNRRVEIEAIAREILKLVREKDVRYRDIALLQRNTNDYHDLIQTVFTDYEIPFFIDQKKSMLHHPLIELIRSTLEVYTSNWRYESVFRAVKTDLLCPIKMDVNVWREDMDQLENYVLAYGINGSKWTSKDPFKYRRYRGLEDSPIAQTDSEQKFEDKLNDLREMIVTPIHRLQKRFRKAKTGRQMCEALFQYLEELEIPKKLEGLQNQAEKAGKLHASREHGQVWNAIIELMDQFVEVLRDEQISLKLFTKIMETGMDSMQFALVPPAIDQVLVANFDRSRLSNIKYTFIIGVNEGIIPAKPNEEGLFSEKDRENLSRLGIELAPGSRSQLLNENFNVYLSFLSPAHHLYISYPLADEEGKALLPSVYVKRLQDIFPNLQITALLNDPSEVEEEKQLDFVTNRRMTLPYLVDQLLTWKKNYPIANLWWDIYNDFVTNDEWHEKSRHVINSLFYTNRVKPLKKEISKELYGEELVASVSRIEQFNSCPFAHFTKYGLGLKERQIYQLKAPDIGQLFHSGLKMMADYLRDNKMDWRNLTKEQCEQFSSEIVGKLAPMLQHEILLSTNRHHYLKRKLINIMSKTTSILSEHARLSGFAPIGLELGFGKDESLPPLSFSLENGASINLAGRIDRVDKAESKHGAFLRVIDYKSSHKSLNLTEVYYGIALQMLTYLDVVITHSTSWLGQTATPAGVLYFHVHNPMINSHALLQEDEIESEIFRSFKMEGLVLGDAEVVRMMDESLESGRSTVISAGIKNNGEFYTGSQIASEEEFHYLRTHVRNKFKEAGTNILDGVIDISPYKFKNNVSCANCPFKLICQFDESLEGNEYRIFKQEKRDIILNKIRKEGMKFDS